MAVESLAVKCSFDITRSDEIRREIVWSYNITFFSLMSSAY